MINFNYQFDVTWNHPDKETQEFTCSWCFVGIVSTKFMDVERPSYLEAAPFPRWSVLNCLNIEVTFFLTFFLSQWKHISNYLLDTDLYV